MKAIIFNLLLIISLMSCSKEDASDQQLTFNDFQTSLSSDMDYDSIVKVFGVPVKDVGSGIHIYVYHLKDDTEIWIGYVDRILYAKHQDQSGQVLHTLIE